MDWMTTLAYISYLGAVQCTLWVFKLAPLSIKKKLALLSNEIILLIKIIIELLSTQKPNFLYSN